jgi:hypothetical protein
MTRGGSYLFSTVNKLPPEDGFVLELSIDDVHGQVYEFLGILNVVRLNVSRMRDCLRGGYDTLLSQNNRKAYLRLL